MPTLRENFIEHFGEHDADLIEKCAKEHMPDKYLGSDPFKGALVIAIGFECFTNQTYNEHHGFETNGDEIKEWLKKNKILENYDGDIDEAANAAGAYERYGLIREINVEAAILKDGISRAFKQ
jgi:hypothetical protein